MREIVLLGAGASMEAGVPGADGMSRRMVEAFYEDSLLRHYAPVLSFVAGGLMFQQGVRGDNPYGGIDVEELFNAVQILKERNSLEATPFIGSWHPMVEEFDKINPSRPRLDRSNRAIYDGVTDQILRAFPSKPPAFSERNIDDAINDTIVKTVEATQKGRKPRISSREKVSRAIQRSMSRASPGSGSTTSRRGSLVPAPLLRRSSPKP